MPAKADKRIQSAASPRWRLAVLAAGLLMMVGAVGTWVNSILTDPARLPLETVSITGDLTHVDRGRLQQMVVDAIDGGFFTVDMDKLREAAEQLPWVDNVSLRRVWPQTLVMHVTEQVPLARWGKEALVNGRGEIFQPDGVLPDGLPQMSGPASASMQMVAFHGQASRLLASVGRKVAGLTLRGHQEWQLELDNGLVLLMDQGQAGQALERFVMAMPVISSNKGRVARQLDMRYENGFAVRWMPAAEVNDKNPKQGDA